MSRAPSNLSYSEKHSVVELSSNDPTPQTKALASVVQPIQAQRQYKYSDIALQAGTKVQDQVRDQDSVIQSLMMIIGTNLRSRWYRPEFGVDIERLLFQPLDKITSNEIRSALINALITQRNDSRIVVKDLEVEPDYTNGQYYVAIYVDVPSLGLVHEKVEIGLRKL